MHFGLMVEPQLGGTYEDQVRLARWAEDFGLDVFARSDHYLWDGEPAATDAFACLAGLARDTRRIELAVLVSPISFRHPAVIAKTAATIDEMSEGRLRLGVGTGWNQREHDEFGLTLPAMRERFERLYDALGYLRAAFSGSEGFRGRHYHLGAIAVRPRPDRPLPLIVGGSGRKRTPQLAGEFAAEYNSIVAPPADLAPRIEVMRAAARASGRDPHSILVSVMGSAYVAESEAEYRDLIGAAAEARSISPADFADRLAARGIPRGTPDQARATVEGLAAAGVGRYYLQVFDPLGEISGPLLEPVFAALGGPGS